MSICFQEISLYLLREEPVGNTELSGHGGYRKFPVYFISSTLRLIQTVWHPTKQLSENWIKKDVRKELLVYLKVIFWQGPEEIK
jgi:hypothetical protein